MKTIIKGRVEKARILNELALVQVYAGCDWQNELEIIDWMDRRGIHVDVEPVELRGWVWNCGDHRPVTKSDRTVKMKMAGMETQFSLSQIDTMIKRINSAPAWAFEVRN